MRNIIAIQEKEKEISLVQSIILIILFIFSHPMIIAYVDQVDNSIVFS